MKFSSIFIVIVVVNAQEWQNSFNAGNYDIDNNYILLSFDCYLGFVVTGVHFKLTSCLYVPRKESFILLLAPHSSGSIKDKNLFPKASSYK